MHKGVRSELEGFFSTRKLFTHHDEIDPTETTNKEANPAKPPRDNGVIPPILTQTSSLYTPPTDAPEAL